jgi:hypothetical protein
VFVRRYTDEQLAEAVAASASFTEVLRRLGLRPAGGNHRSVRRHVERLNLSTAHFDPYAAARSRRGRYAMRLADVLVEHSQYPRKHLKRRLYETGLKQRRCELCGQDENWHGAHMALILDHINGVADDNRLENLQIVCPNCAATLDTHCGRNGRTVREPRPCERCRTPFVPRRPEQRYCSRECGVRWTRPGAVSRLGARRAERPPHEELQRLIDEEGFEAVGRRYGVSGNAVRKWLQRYVDEARDAAGHDAAAA